MKLNDLRFLPSVDNLLKSPQADALQKEFGRQLTLDSIRSVLDQIRAGFNTGDSIPDTDTILRMVSGELEQKSLITLKRSN